MNKSDQIANRLVQGANAKKIGLSNRNLSFGPRRDSAKNMLEEKMKPEKISIRVNNFDDVIKHIIIVPYIPTSGTATLLNATQFGTIAALLADTSSTLALMDGELEKDGSDVLVSAECVESGRSIQEILRYIAKNPTRILGMRMRSKTADDSDKDTSNFENSMKTFFFTPFDRHEEKQLSLAPLQVGGANFNQDMLDVDFQKENFPVILSDEHGFQVSINPNTSLTMTFYIGAQDSKAQRFWRQVKESDNLLRGEDMFR